MPVPDREDVPEKTNQTEQYVLNYSFDEVYKILMVGLAGYNASTGSYDRYQIDNDTGGLKVGNKNPQAVKITTVGSATYMGFAPVGTSEASALWQAKKIDVTGDTTTITWADGNANFDNVATDLTVLTYN